MRECYANDSVALLIIASVRCALPPGNNCYQSLGCWSMRLGENSTHELLRSAVGQGKNWGHWGVFSMCQTDFWRPFFQCHPLWTRDEGLGVRSDLTGPAVAGTGMSRPVCSLAWSCGMCPCCKWQMYAWCLKGIWPVLPMTCMETMLSWGTGVLTQTGTVSHCLHSEETETFWVIWGHFLSSVQSSQSTFPVISQQFYPVVQAACRPLRRDWDKRTWFVAEQTAFEYKCSLMEAEFWIATQESSVRGKVSWTLPNTIGGD